jgi:hypothetical protein
MTKANPTPRHILAVLTRNFIQVIPHLQGFKTFGSSEFIRETQDIFNDFFRMNRSERSKCGAEAQRYQGHEKVSAF